MQQFEGSELLPMLSIGMIVGKPTAMAIKIHNNQLCWVGVHLQIKSKSFNNLT